MISGAGGYETVLCNDVYQVIRGRRSLGHGLVVRVLSLFSRNSSQEEKNIFLFRFKMLPNLI